MNITKGEPTEVTVIGLGDMGHALAQSLLNHNHTVSVWNRSADKANSLISKGAVLITEIAEALTASSITIICVSDHKSTMAILDSGGIFSVSEEDTFIQLSTITSVESIELGLWAKHAGVNYLDGQILSYPDDVLEGRASIVCSGEKALFDKLQPLLVDMAGNVDHVGEQIGAAPSFDKAHLAWAMGNYLVFLQAAAMCKRSGVNLRVWCEYNLKYMESGAAHRELSILADQICSQNYEHGLDARMDVWKNAIDKTIEQFESIGMNDTHLTRLSMLTNSAIESGMGEKEIGVLFEEMIAETEH